ncbi:MAG: hypothetical protein ACOCR1_04190 [Planctomycetota bacterium]
MRSSVELFTFARELHLDLRLIPVGATVIGSVAQNRLIVVRAIAR